MPDLYFFRPSPGFHHQKVDARATAFAGRDEHFLLKEPGKNLATYLRDHHAGGIGALELLDRLRKAGEDAALRQFFDDLHADVQWDHDQLHHLMTALGVDESSVRDATAWLGEKFSRPKLGLATQTHGLALLEALETLIMGIGGKRLLWRALGKVSMPTLERTDFARLEKRATEQLDRVEAKRLDIVRELFRAGEETPRRDHE